MEYDQHNALHIHHQFHAGGANGLYECLDTDCTEYDHSGNLGHDCGENCMDAGADGDYAELEPDRAGRDAAAYTDAKRYHQGWLGDPEKQ